MVAASQAAKHGFSFNNTIFVYYTRRSNFSVYTAQAQKARAR